MKDKKYKVGYTTGVFDLFHVGHLNILRRSKKMCDFLIVGVSTDDLVQYKNKRPVIPFEERIQIVNAIKYVDKTIPQVSLNKIEAYYGYKFDVIFVGDDWKNTKKWEKIEKDFKDLNVDIVYFPYTKGTSSTLINEVLIKLRSKEKRL